MKISKELKTGIIAVTAIGLLVTGVNFLKGNSFFGGDDIYYAYFPNSGGVTAATNVMVNGVIIGKVLEVDLDPKATDTMKRVIMKFNIQEDDFFIPKNATLEAGATDLFGKGIIIKTSSGEIPGYYKVGDKIQGQVQVDLQSQIKQIAEPLVNKVQTAVTGIDNMITSFSAFWDTTAQSELQGSMKELQAAIHKLGNVANEVENLVVEEKVKLSRILSNVESISNNIKQSNEDISEIIGNTKQISADLVSADFKGTITEAQLTLSRFNKLLEDANNGEGSLGKLLKDEQLYNDLNATNEKMQSLVQDIQLHPERYIHFSVFGAKSKVQFTPGEEKKIREEINK